MSGDALTDTDLNALVERHRSAGGIATLTVKKVHDTREYGVVIHDADGRIQGFQEKPDPAEALSDLGNCGIYCFSPEIFDYFPRASPFADWAQDVFPALLEGDVPFHVHEIDDYWNDVGSLEELRQGTFDALDGQAADRASPRASAPDGVEVIGDDPVWVGAGRGVRRGRAADGAGGDRATAARSATAPRCASRSSSRAPTSPPGEILIGAIHGGAGITERLRPARALG